MDRTSEFVEDGSDLNFDETAAGIDVPGIRRSTRVRVPTERGLDYQLPLCKKPSNSKLSLVYGQQTMTQENAFLQQLNPSTFRIDN